MGLLDSDRAEEIMLIIGDSWQGRNKKWLIGLLAVIILAIPIYFVIRISVYNLAISTYNTPDIKGQVERIPIEQLESGYINISGNTWSPFVKLKNSNLDWGIPKLQYHAEVKSSDGTLLSSITNETFMLPASEKYVLLPRFTSAKPPVQTEFMVLSSQFVLKPDLPEITLDVQRTQILPQTDQTVTTAVLKNNSPFTITQVDLTALIYNERSQVVAMNYTNINDLLSGELRSFQLIWPARLSGQLRAELTPELNIFDKDIIKTQGPVSPFDDR